MNRTIAATALFVCAGLAQGQSYYTGFEEFTAGTGVDGQHGWYTPAVAGTVGMTAYVYGTDPYALPANPTGSSQLIAGRSEGGTALARAQYNFDFSTNDRWAISYDMCPKYDGVFPITPNLASFSLNDPVLTTGFKQFISLNNFVDVNDATLGWKAEYNVSDAAGVALVNQSAGPEWTGLAYGQWYRLETVVNFSTNQIESVSITDLSTCQKTTANPAWYVTGGSASVLPLPLSVRCFVGGATAGSISGFDNIMIRALGGCEADFNGDNQVDFFDYLDFAAAFDAQTANADFNGDCQVDFFDYLDFAAAFDGCQYAIYRERDPERPGLKGSAVFPARRARDDGPDVLGSWSERDLSSFAARGVLFVQNIAQDIQPSIHSTGEATGILPVAGGSVKPITVIGTNAIRATFDAVCLKQAINSRLAPGVSDVVLNPDAHCGYGAPVGCVLVSPTHVYPGPVGVDIKCSMSLLQLDLPEDQVADKALRRALIDAILQRTPTGAGKGQRSVRKARRVGPDLGRRVVVEGASEGVLNELGIPPEWATRCEDAFHRGHDDTTGPLEERVDRLLETGTAARDLFADKIGQLGSYGGGNHFGECEVVHVGDSERARASAAVFGLEHGKVAFLSHCGSRGWGAFLANRQFKSLQKKFAEWDIPLPGNDRELVYAPLGTPEADSYLDDMALGANFATVNHLLINALVLEAFREVIPGVNGRLVYFISHNIARREIVDQRPAWVHRKGATRAFPAGHHALRGTPFEATGHPILLPGNPRDGSSVMVAEPGAKLSCYSVNHGAGRRMSRTAANRSLDQEQIDLELAKEDILSNCREYPRDEAPGAYKDFGEVLKSVELAGLASEVARLRARFVIKDASKPDD